MESRAAPGFFVPGCRVGNAFSNPFCIAQLYLKTPVICGGLVNVLGVFTDRGIQRERARFRQEVDHLVCIVHLRHSQLVTNFIRQLPTLF